MAVETFSDGIPPEVAPVRPGEELPWERLKTYVSPLLGVTGPMTVMQFPNGSANLTYLLTFGNQQFVLRRPPFGAIAPGAHDMKREYRVLSRLWREFDRAPRAYVFCDDHDVVGSDFVVSEYRRGEVVWATLPPSMAGLPEAWSPDRVRDRRRARRPAPRRPIALRPGESRSTRWVPRTSAVGLAEAVGACGDAGPRCRDDCSGTGAAANAANHPIRHHPPQRLQDR